jgi:hypothetical protein
LQRAGKQAGSRSTLGQYGLKTQGNSGVTDVADGHATAGTQRRKRTAPRWSASPTSCIASGPGHRVLDAISSRQRLALVCERRREGTKVRRYEYSGATCPLAGSRIVPACAAPKGRFRDPSAIQVPSKSGQLGSSKQSGAYRPNPDAWRVPKYPDVRACRMFATRRTA